MTPSLLFIRDYQAFQGGHLKVADYIAHTQASGMFAPQLFMVPGSRTDHPFSPAPIIGRWHPAQADALFLAGMDWLHVPKGLENRVPVINLIQHPRHALPGDPRFAFLERRATRICVSEAVAQALRATGKANGPILTIPAGLSLLGVPPVARGSHHVLICGLKQPGLALETAILLRDEGVPVTVLTAPIPRADFLQALSRACIAILLPDGEEGFYLPALEAMAAGCAVVCPDALGNRAFCRDGETCLMPARSPPALAQAAKRLFGDPALAAHLVRNGQAEARTRSLDAERAAFLPLLADLRRAISPASARA